MSRRWPPDVSEMLPRFAEHWSPKTVARVNDYEIKVLKLRGELGEGPPGSGSSRSVRSGDSGVPGVFLRGAQLIITILRPNTG